MTSTPKSRSDFNGHTDPQIGAAPSEHRAIGRYLQISNVPMCPDYAEWLKNGIIYKQEFIAVIQATISYVVRRVICEVPTNSLNKTFATFYGKINKEKYLKSVLAEYVIKDSYRAFPTDAEVKEKLLTKDIYHLRIKNYILEVLENEGHKEPISITGNGLTVEHIMPQNPNLSNSCNI